MGLPAGEHGPKSPGRREIDLEDDGDLNGTPEYTSLDVSLTVGTYMFANAGVSVFQKLAVTAMPLPLFLVAIQVFATLLLLIPFTHTIKMGTYDEMLKFMPISFCFFVMLTGSMVAYQYCTLGTIVVVGSISPLLTLFIEYACFDNHKTVITWHTLVSLIVTVIGVCLYGSYKSEIEAQLIGMVALVTKILVAIYYQTRQRYLMVEEHISISDTGMMVYNNVVTLAGSMLLMAPLGEFQALSTIEVTPFGIFSVGASCLFCGLIGYSAFRTQRRVSATTFLIVVNVCKVAVVLFGYLYLRETYNTESALACGLVLLGAAWYAWDRKEVKRIAAQREIQEAEAFGPLKETEGGPDAWGLLEENERRRERRAAQNAEDSATDAERDF